MAALKDYTDNSALQSEVGGSILWSLNLSKLIFKLSCMGWTNISEVWHFLEMSRFFSLKSGRLEKQILIMIGIALKWTEIIIDRCSSRNIFVLPTQNVTSFRGTKHKIHRTWKMVISENHRELSQIKFSLQ